MPREIKFPIKIHIFGEAADTAEWSRRHARSLRRRIEAASKNYLVSYFEYGRDAQREDASNLLRHEKRVIREADVVIGIFTSSSFEIGMKVGYALIQCRKPVLLIMPRGIMLDSYHALEDLCPEGKLRIVSPIKQSEILSDAGYLQDFLKELGLHAHWQGDIFETATS